MILPMRDYQISFRLTSLLDVFRYFLDDECERATEGTAYNPGEELAICPGRVAGFAITRTK